MIGEVLNTLPEANIQKAPENDGNVSKSGISEIPGVNFQGLCLLRFREGPIFADQLEVGCFPMGPAFLVGLDSDRIPENERDCYTWDIPRIPNYRATNHQLSISWLY